MSPKGVSSLTEESLNSHRDVLATVVVAGDSDMNEMQALHVNTFIAGVPGTMARLAVRRKSVYLLTLFSNTDTLFLSFFCFILK